MTDELTSDHALAAQLACDAGELLNGLRSDIGDAEYDAKALKASGDAKSHEFLMKRLAIARPDDAVLSEEGADSEERLGADRVWIVDPLDGTREFSERSEDGPWRDDWAVHVALWSKSDGLIAGAVALPGRAQVFDTADSDVVQARHAAGEAGRPMKLAASRSHPPKLIDDIAEEYDVELVRMGSAGVKAMSVLTGEADAYIHAGGQYEWDSAAPVAVARTHGLHASRLDGTDLIYNRADPWLPDLFICRPSLVPRITEILAAMNHEEQND